MRCLAGDIRDAIVLDLGCGYGWFCRWAVEDGGVDSVLGTDISEKMLERAESWRSVSSEVGSKISYEQRDLENILLSEGAYNLVYSSLALHYLPRSAIQSLFKQVYLSLKPGGRFVFLVEHPVMTAPSVLGWKKSDKDEFYWPLNHYIDEGLRVTSWLGSDDVKRYHLTTETYLNLLFDADFVLDSSRESLGEIGAGATNEKAESGYRPLFLMIGAKRA